MICMKNNSASDSTDAAVTRRAALGLAAASVAAAVSAEDDKPSAIVCNSESVKQAEWISGLQLTDEQCEATAIDLRQQQAKVQQLRAIPVDYDVLPALRFDPEMVEPGILERTSKCPAWLSSIAAMPAQSSLLRPEELSFLSVRMLGRLLRDKQVTAVELAQHCIAGLKQYAPTLKCVVTLTEELALQRAAVADKELAAGKDRGPLHGIPWGAKDLISVAGYPTTWGAPQFRDQITEKSATVVDKLQAAGAVLVAKLSLGALAMGDQWFGGQTRNPWNKEQGSSGSSAGSASAVAAGLVPFALGSETLGSIVSPTRRCGVAGLRPTFGRISRSGCMPLSWSMDKLGPIARHIDDCGTVFDVIHGSDFHDPTAVDRWFKWPMQINLSRLRIGQVDGVRLSEPDEVTLNVLKELGAQIVPVELPNEFPEWAIALMLDVESATVFHDLLAKNETEGWNTWPDTFRTAHFLSAVDYLQAARVRFQLMKAMVSVFEKVDLYIGGGDLGICNLTGHPTVVVPTLMLDDQEHPQPQCSTLTGRLHDEATLLAVAQLIEERVGMTSQHPTLSD
jgi:Asp-tRNA(Asn)/Glu-tRNA(Gln) amidotransferase A subunit family amidase